MDEKLRALIAINAMNAIIIAAKNHISVKEVSRLSVGMADALLVELGKRTP